MTSRPSVMVSNQGALTTTRFPVCVRTNQNLSPFTVTHSLSLLVCNIFALLLVRSGLCYACRKLEDQRGAHIQGYVNND
ncbi:hypothetical protein ACHWQZ_G014073 [Mnemiopsis leidyi]